MALRTPPLINPSHQTNGGDDGAAGALASATLAERKQGSRTPRGPKVSNNFGPVPACRNPARGAKINGGMAEAEAAGGSPRKKPHDPSPRKKPRGKEIFLLHLDPAKATAEHGRTEPLELEGDPDERADGGRPKKGLLKTTRAPRVTQEDDRENLDSEEEEVDGEDDNDLKDDDDEELDAACDEATLESTVRDGGAIARTDKATREPSPACPCGAKELYAARNEATLESILACPRGAKRDGGASNRTDEATLESLPARPRGAKRDGGGTDNATRESIPARPRGAKRDGSASNWTDGGRPKNSLPKSTGNLDYNDEEPDNGDIKDMSLEDEGETTPRWRAGTHHPQVSTALFGSTEGGGTTTGFVLARRSIEADYAPPGSTSNRQAHNSQVPGAPLAALFA